MIKTQNDHCKDRGDQEGYKRLTEEVEDRSDRFGRRKYTEYRFHDDQYKRDQDNPNDCAKLGKLGLIKLFLIHYVIRNGDKILLAADRSPDRTCHDHGKCAAEYADQDDPSEVNAEHCSHKNRTGCRRDKSVTDRKSCQQRNRIIQCASLGLLRKGECKRDQNDQTCVEENGHCYDQAGDAQRPCGFLVTELFDHCYSQRLRASRSFQDSAEHRSKAD